MIETSLGHRVRRGLAWSTVNNLVLRLSGLLVGILLARLLSPQSFGLYAVGLTAQTIVMTLAEMGMSADLIRHGDIRRRAPTVATLGLVISVLLAVLTCIVAEPAARLLGDAAGAPIIRVLSITIVLSGVSAVPYAIAQREFLQKKQFAVDSAGLVISTGLTLVLVAVGFGAMALAISRVAAQVFTTAAQFRFTRTVPRFGFDRTIARSVLAFGVPLAAGNFLSWLLLNVDYMVVGNRGGAVTLGLYVLAFNLSSWPTSVVGTAIRSVAFPAFSQLKANMEQLRVAVVSATQLAWAASLPIGFCLATLAQPFVVFLYGEKWRGSAVPLVGLAVFGILRVVFDVMASCLIATGDSARLLLIQGIWIVLLAPAMWFGIERYGLSGAGWAHVAVALLAVYPLYLWAMGRNAVPARDLARAAIWPVLAAVPATTTTLVVGRLVGDTIWGVLAGGGTGVTLYALLLLRWVKRRLDALRSSAQTLDEVATTTPPAPDVSDSTPAADASMLGLLTPGGPDPSPVRVRPDLGPGTSR